MPNAKQVVKVAGERLLDSELGKLAHIRRLWEGMTWFEMDVNSTNGADLTDKGIILYPRRLRDDDAYDYVLRAFGMAVFMKLDETERNHWHRKHSLPTKDQVDVYNGRINDKHAQASLTSYKELVETFETAVDRLVAINFSNALAANGVPFRQSFGYNVYTYGPTAEYANRKRYHSLAPLLSAYADALFSSCYGAALADLVLHDLNCVRESSTQGAVRGLITGLAERAR